MVREIFEYFKALISRDDLIAFAKGQLFKENIVNVYLKILEKASHLVHASYNYHRNSYMTPDGFEVDIPPKIMYFNTNFCKRLNSPEHMKDCVN
jgi:hypothetical protein